MKNLTIDWPRIQEKWRARWEETHIFESNPGLGKKYFLTVAYPYPNSPQHIGHGRTYTLADVHARYKRMQGFNVLLPMAFHYTGTPILAMSRRLASGDEDLADTFTRIYKVPPEILHTFHEPLNIAKYFHQEIKQGMKEMGYSIDWRREFTTIDPHYSRFIEWQFKKLLDHGLIIQGSHPVGWCPNCGNPVGQHDTLNDVEPEIGEYILIKFLHDGYVIPTATLRPETIFGVTNIWLRPDTQYSKALVNGERWIISRESIHKLHYLNRRVVEEGIIEGKELIGKYVENPATGVKVPILPASFVDPKNGTGIVMSVPGHAPYDLQALEDIKVDSSILIEYGVKPEIVQSITTISIIKSEGYGEVPAYDIVKRKGIESQKDAELEKATSELYAHEFHAGRMKENTLQYSGLLVSEARNRVRADLIKEGKADTIYEIMNSPIFCRCGAECVVKIFENQWFINYGDSSWKALSRECTSQMSLLPEDIRLEFEYTIGWLREKACARKSGLGTALPWDKDWVIESLSDSVIYMAYYTISKYINAIPVEKLNEEVFDYIFLGRGDLKEVAARAGLEPRLLEDMRREFTYFYPLDSRHSGRDLVPNHLTFFIFNHAAIFPKELWPRQVVVNGSVLMGGKKMSKSFGNIIPLRDAVKTYGADPLRLAILATAELLQDADLSVELIGSFRERLERLYTFTEEVMRMQGVEGEVELMSVDRWLLSRLQRHIIGISEAMEKLRVREAIQYTIYILDQDIQWYMRRTLSDTSPDRRIVKTHLLREVLDVRIRLLASFAPFICEELWEMMGKQGLVAQAEWPKPDDKKIDDEAEEAEDLIARTLEDISNIIRVTKIKPRRIVLYTASLWKHKAYHKALKMIQEGSINMQALMKYLLDDTSLKEKAKEVSKYVKKLPDEVSSLPKSLKEKRMKISGLDELKVLCGAVEFYGREFNASIEVYSEDDVKKYDPAGRAPLAQPYRPAIYIE